MWYEKSESEWFDGLDVSCSQCAGHTFRKEVDILDVWFDSGVSWRCVIEKEFNNPVPSTVMYLEGSDQHRGWFQTSLIPSVLLRGKAPFDTVLTHGFVVDGKGHKMSKSQGNVMAPQDMIQKYGADILRLWVAMSDYRNDVRLSPDIVNHVVDMYRRFRNAFRFLLQNTVDFSYATDQVPFSSLDALDQGILVQFDDVKQKVLSAYETYDFHGVLSELNKFVAGPLSGFYFDAQKDRLYCEAASSPLRRSAQTSLYHLAHGITVLLAPLLSFTSEETFLELRRMSNPHLPESVLLENIDQIFKTPLSQEEQKNIIQQLAILQGFREGVHEILDQKKKAGDVKTSQEVKVIYNPHPERMISNVDVIAKLKNDIPFLFQVAEVQVESANLDQPGVRVEKSVHAKCERCWRYRSTVGKNDLHPTLCDRCVTAVGLPV